MLRISFFVLCLALPAEAQLIDLSKPEILEPINVKTEAVTLLGKKAIKLTDAEPGKDRGPKSPGTMAILKGAQFRNGTIELELAGQPAGGASEAARGFVGLAFRVQGQGDRYEHFYIRPTNGRANDQVRRNHSAQYASHPEYPWFRLRKEEPEKYESYVDLQPGVWTRIRLTISGTAAKLFVHGADQPCLIVNDLKMGALAGGLALWIGPQAEGYFTTLRVQNEP